MPRHAQTWCPSHRIEYKSISRPGSLSALSWKLSASCQKQLVKMPASPHGLFSQPLGHRYDLSSTINLPATWWLPYLLTENGQKEDGMGAIKRWCLHICLIRRVVFPKVLNPVAKSFCFRYISATKCNYKRLMPSLTWKNPRPEHPLSLWITWK